MATIHIDETEFDDLILTEAKRVRLAIQKEPENTVYSDHPTVTCKIALWNDSSPLAIRSFQFLREASNYGDVFSITAEGMKGPLYLFLAPCKIVDTKLEYLSREDFSKKGAVNPIVVEKEESSKQWAKDITQNVVELQMRINGCYTSRILSPVYLVIGALGSLEACGSVAVSKAISIYEQYTDNVENVAPLLTAVFNGNSILLNELLLKKHNVNQVDKHGASALHIAAQYGHFDCIKVLLSHKADIDLKDNDQQTALHKCAFVGHTRTMQLLLSANATIDAHDRKGATPLHTAAFKGRVECVEMLLAHHANVSEQDRMHSTPLHQSAFRNQLDITKLLLDARANPMDKDRKGNTPLDLAASSGSTNTLALLFQYNGRVDDNSLLQHTAYHGHSECLKLLIENGLNADMVDQEMAAPIHKACFQGNEECVRILLSHQCDVSVQDEAGCTPLHHACFQGHVQCASMLLEHQADPNARDNEAGTPLHAASANGHSDVVALLLARGAQVNLMDHSGHSALFAAAGNGHYDCIDILLKYKATPTSTDHLLRSALHYAISSVQVIELLVKAGCDINGIDYQGNTPLIYAVQHALADSVKFLLFLGADHSVVNHLQQDALSIASEHIATIIRAESANGKEMQRILKTYEEAAVKFNQKPRTGIEHLLQSDLCAPPPAPSSSHSLKQGKSTMTQAHLPISTSSGSVISRAPLKAPPTAASTANLASHKMQPLSAAAPSVAPVIIDRNSTLAKDVIVQFLHRHGNHLNKVKVGEFISEPDDWSLDILSRYVSYLDFLDMEFDVALRTFLSKFRLPGEAQKIDRIMEKFAGHFYLQNKHHNIFPTEDQAYLLAFSLIMLNTDLHNPSIKHKMTKEQFVKNNSDTGLEHDLPPEFLARMYECIRDKEIKMETEDTQFGNSVAVKMGWLTKQGGRIKTWKRRWFILSDCVLYYFKEKQEETSKACGIVPLEDIVVTEAEAKKKYCFELSHASNTTVKAMKRNQGQIQKGHHDSYFICAANRKEMREWIDAISQNTIKDPFRSLMERKVNKAREYQIEDELANFPQLVEQADMCQAVVAGRDVVREKYTHAVYFEGTLGLKGGAYAVITHQQHRLHTIVIVSALWEAAQWSDWVARPHDSLEALGVPATLKLVRNNVSKLLKKDYSVHIVSHSLGGVVASLLAVWLHQKAFQVSSLVTFGSPNSLSEREVEQVEETKITVTNVALHDDPLTALSSSTVGYVSVGTKILLLNGAHYCVVKESDEEADSDDPPTITDDVLRYHSINEYASSLRQKLQLAVRVQYHLRAHYK